MSVRVAYWIQRFPRVSETFILREMSWLGRHEVDLYIFPVLPSSTKVVNTPSDMWRRVCYSPAVSINVLKAQWKFLRHSPKRYVRALTMILRQAYREPLFLLACLLLFPKAVYYAELMKKLGIEHVHAHYAWTAAVVASAACELIGTPLSVHTHAFDLFALSSSGVRARLQTPTKIVTVSTFNLKHILRLVPAADVEVIRCGIDPERFVPVVNASGSTIHILSVGRLIEKKGHVYLIDACAKLKQKGVEFRCSIVGTGPLYHALLNQINDNDLQSHVRLLGAMDQTQVLQLNQHSDIFVLPCVVAEDGDRDGLPVALIEAMACGIPVISTAVTAIAELVDDGVTGLLVKERDASALALALQTLIGNESLRSAMGRLGRQRVLRDYTLQNNTARLSELFHQLAFKQPNSKVS